MSDTLDHADGTQATHPAVAYTGETEKESLGTSNSERESSSNDLEKSATTPDDLEQDLTRIDTADYPHGLRLFFIFTALVLSIFLASLDMTIVATAIPRITDEFHSLDQVGWYGAAFFLTIGSFQSTWGKAYKYFSLKTTFLLSFASFELGSLLCGVAQNSITLIVGRAIAGMSIHGFCPEMKANNW